LARKRQTAAPFRLTPTVRPDHYRLSLEVDPAADRTYRGKLVIELHAERPIETLELHAAQLTISGAWFSTGPSRQRAEVLLVPEHETVRLLLPVKLPAGPLQVELAFRGRLQDDLRGLYYVHRESNHYAFTQLEAADARRFFPCFDEPAFKARFSIDVTTAANYAVISNSPEIGVERLPGGRKRVSFAPTPLLSTYLVALAVGTLKASRPVMAGKVPIRVWHVPGQPKLSAFALEAARECLLRLQRYFGVPYPYAKLDLVAVPDFEAGAMENAGAVFFRETLLLVDEKRATLREKKRAIEVICHELAHMWYGNLVTMAWWDDLWLNEAFATWMAFEIVDRYRPELRMWNDFGHSRSSALNLDALDSTHPIYTAVANATEATQNFDLITYEKGAAVIRMLERYLGPARFQRGVREYIKRHRESNATAADLWRALENHAGQAVGKVVRPWIERAGFPLLRVTAASESGARSLVLAQERFTAKGPGTRLPDPPWQVPVVIKLGAAQKVRSLRTLVARRQERQPLPRDTRFVYANAEEGGFYRPLHDPSLLRELFTRIERLTAGERLGLVGHTWAFVHAGYSSLPDLLDLQLALANEADPDVLSALYAPLWHVVDRIAPAARPLSPGGEPARARLRGAIAANFRPAWKRIGAEPARKEPELAHLRRAELLRLLALLGEAPDIVAQTERTLERYLKAPETLEANLVSPVLIVGARTGGARRHGHYVQASEHAPTPQERLRFRMALAEFRDEACIDRTLQLMRGPTIPTQDIPSLLARMFDNPSARESTWAFLQRRWKEIERRVPPMLASRLIDATPALANTIPGREIVAFFKRHPLPTAERALRQARERIALDAALRKRAAPLLSEWLSNHPA
jgi:puromycin-sensitive aminopeptidase